MTFFNMLDMNKDGTVIQKEFVDGLMNLRIRNIDAEKLSKIFEVLD